MGTTIFLLLEKCAQNQASVSSDNRDATREQELKITSEITDKRETILNPEQKISKEMSHSKFATFEEESQNTWDVSDDEDSNLAQELHILSEASDTSDSTFKQQLKIPSEDLDTTHEQVVQITKVPKTCNWVDPITSTSCLQKFDSIKKIADHVNSVHIEEGGGNEQQACHWLGCKRGGKPLHQKKVRMRLTSDIFIVKY